MAYCDLCNQTITGEARNIPPAEFRSAVLVGLRPPPELFASAEGVGMTRSMVEQNWINRVNSDPTDWVLCPACLARYRQFSSPVTPAYSSAVAPASNRDQATPRLKEPGYTPAYPPPVSTGPNDSIYTPAMYIRYAGFWERAAASIIDSFVTGIIGGILGFILGLVWGLTFRSNDDTSMLILQCISSAGGLLLGWLYFAILESSSSQGSLGKMALGIKVTDTDGNRIGFGRATGRYFGKMISALILYIGFLMVAWDERKQGLHDKMAGTLVVKK
ncbi:MAG TPA: RDD family protein [Anaerolineaceae bacterium]